MVKSEGPDERPYEKQREHIPGCRGRLQVPGTEMDAGTWCQADCKCWCHQPRSIVEQPKRQYFDCAECGKRSWTEDMEADIPPDGYVCVSCAKRLGVHWTGYPGD